MSDVAHVAPGDGGGAAAPIAVTTPASDTPSHTPSDLGRMLAQLRHNKAQESAEPATEPEPDSAAEAETAAPVDEQAPGDTTEATEPAEQPPIEPPRSWTKEQTERWQSLPRETQEYLSQREQERDRELRRSQNEAADQRKAIDAERQAAEKARQEYEAKLPSLMQALTDVQAGSFADIRNVDDVTRLAQEDPFRYLQWQAHQTKVQAVQAEIDRAAQRQAGDKQNELAKFIKDEDAKFSEFVPEMKDAAKASELRSKAIAQLNELGFTDQELGELASGQKSLSIHDHRLHRLIHGWVKLNDAQKAKTTVAAKPVPPVQKPGVAPPRGTATTERIKVLSDKLERSGSHKDLASLIGAYRTSRA